MPSAERLDAVTIDAMGTLVELDAPVERLAQALQDRGLDTSAERVAEAFHAEVGYYLAHKLDARDTNALGELRRECSRVFLEAAGAPSTRSTSRPHSSTRWSSSRSRARSEALHRLRAAGLALACVSDWDIGLGEQLEAVGLDHLFELVLTSAEVGAAKPDPKLFVEATARLGVEPGAPCMSGTGKATARVQGRRGSPSSPFPLATVPDRLGSSNDPAGLFDPRDPRPRAAHGARRADRRADRGATTFAFETAEQFGRVMSEEEYGFLYTRLRNPTVEDLNAVLADLEGAEAARPSRPAWPRSRPPCSRTSRRATRCSARASSTGRPTPSSRAACGRSGST